MICYPAGGWLLVVEHLNISSLRTQQATLGRQLARSVSMVLLELLELNTSIAGCTSITHLLRRGCEVGLGTGRGRRRLAVDMLNSLALVVTHAVVCYPCLMNGGMTGW